jgi:hypothetical protein
MTKNIKCAPIALFVYNRAEHLAKTIDSLKSNFLADSSQLFVFSDGAKNDRDFAAVKNVRDYLKKIQGFKTVNIIERNSNFGLSKSIISGVTQICQNFGRVIVLEDDMILSKYFLQFMNEALDFYEKDDRVLSIHGYIYPTKRKLPENFFLKYPGCWGWATWKRGWDLFEPDGNKLLSNLYDSNKIDKFNFYGGYGFEGILKEQILHKNDSWAIRWNAKALLSDKLTLFPGTSLIFNIGHDASGSNCAKSKVFDVVLSDKPIKLKLIPVQENNFAFKQFEKFFRNMNKPVFYKRFLNPIKYIVKILLGRSKCRF